jgi:four helix bundle suffix protein
VSTPGFSEIAANGALVLLAVACALLDRQLAAQANAFEIDGGFTERLYRVRSQQRSTSSIRFTKSTLSTSSTKSTESTSSTQKSTEVEPLPH